MTVTREWWRPTTAPAHEAPAIRPDVRPASPFAFGAMLVFTCVLLLAPQAYFPFLAPLRIALWPALAAAAAYLFERLSNNRPVFLPRRELTLVACLLGWAAATVPFSMWAGGSFDVLSDQFLKSVVVLWLLASLVTSVPRLRRTAWVLTLLSFPMSAAGISNYFTGSFLHTGAPVLRIEGYEAGLTDNPNDLALMLNLLLPLSVALLLTERHACRRAVQLALIASSLTAIVLTFSRGGFVTTAAIGAMYLWRFRRRPERRWLYLALVLGLICLPALPGAYVERISTMTDIDADATGSAEARWRDMGAALRYLISHPVVGAGLGNDQLALNGERGSYWSAVHNAYLQFGVDLGLPGLILFVLILVGCLRKLSALGARQTVRGGRADVSRFAEGLQVSLGAFAVAAMFHPVAYNFYFYYMAGLALGLSTAYDHPAARRAGAAAIAPEVIGS